MGEAKRRKELGLPPREKPVELKLPVLDKENIQKKVRSFLYKNPIIPFVFYGLVLGAFGWGLYNLVKGYQLLKSWPLSINHMYLGVHLSFNRIQHIYQKYNYD